MPTAGLRGWLVPGVLATLVLLAIGLSLGRGLLQGERAAYERGVAIATLYYHCRGAFPSARYLERAFSWGDPKTCAEIQQVDEKPKP
ncbi:MAG: hypothetical protein FJ245_02945 [Nitrospira sp.]|nr:hypothetical protein [Nitrospira sp.]